MFISDHILKSLADDFTRERRGEASARRRPTRTHASLRSKLTRVRKDRASSATPVPVPADETSYS